MSISMKMFAAAAAAALLLSGCSSVSLDDSAANGAQGADSAMNGAQGAQGVNPFNDPGSPLYHRSVYFGFDSYEVSSEYMPYLQAQAKWLAAHPDVSIVIQGNTDERGGREYNLALGQKRSEAVKQRFQLLGVPASRMEAVSFGREKPAAEGHDESAWSQNRRADIVFPDHVTK